MVMLEAGRIVYHVVMDYVLSTIIALY
jgi:hypothetical protein